MARWPQSNFLFFFFNDTATTEIYTLSLHDALPISTQCRPLAVLDRSRRDGHRHRRPSAGRLDRHAQAAVRESRALPRCGDRKSTRLNSSHSQISYAVFCLKKKKTTPSYSSSKSDER